MPAHSPSIEPDCDVLIVGAGISGISAACHLRTLCPGRRFRIVEARDSFGGTWDLFRYPGIRSDSDMHTFGYINASWTLRADLNSRFVCDMLKHMQATGTEVCTPVLSEDERTMPTREWVTDFNPGYFRRALHLFPRQGSRVPWRNTQDYLLDRKLLRRAAEQCTALTYR